MSCDAIPFADALATLLATYDGTWSGTSAELHALLPGHAADAPRLAKLLTQTAGQLAAAGIAIERKRQPGTGARIIVLSHWADRSLTVADVTISMALDAAALDAERDVVTVSRPVAGVTLPAHGVDAVGRPDRPLLPCPICGARSWQWHQSPRRRASRWRCLSCEPQL